MYLESVVDQDGSNERVAIVNTGTDCPIYLGPHHASRYPIDEGRPAPG